MRFWVPMRISAGKILRDGRSDLIDFIGAFAGVLVGVFALVLMVAALVTVPLFRPFQLLVTRQHERREFRELLRLAKDGRNAQMMRRALEYRLKVWPNDRMYRVLLRAFDLKERRLRREIEAQRRDLEQRLKGAV